MFLLVRSSSLQGTTIASELYSTLIDEIPMIAVMAAYASGQTIIRDAGELRVKDPIVLLPLSIIFVPWAQMP